VRQHASTCRSGQVQPDEGEAVDGDEAPWQTARDGLVCLEKFQGLIPLKNGNFS